MKARIVFSKAAAFLALGLVALLGPIDSYATPSPAKPPISVMTPDGTLYAAPGYQPAELGPEYTANPPIIRPGDTHVRDEVVLRFRSDVTADQQNSLMAAYGMQFARSIYGDRAFVAKVPEGTALAVANGLRNNPLLEIADVNTIMHLYHDEANDTYRPDQGHLNTINAGGSTGGWQYGHGIRDVSLIAIIDSGIDMGGLDGIPHPDHLPKYRAERWLSFFGGPADRDDVGHGTHVAGLAAVTTNNQLGVAGVGYGSSPMSLKAIDDNGFCGTEGPITSIASAVNWASSHGASVINMSLGCTRGSYMDCDPTNPQSVIHMLKRAVDTAHVRGITVVAAAGNAANTVPNYPASFGQVPEDPWRMNEKLIISVPGTWRLERHYRSSYGNTIDFGAPMAEDADQELGLLSTFPTEPSCIGPTYYGRLRGTSMSAPQVSGLAALVTTLGYSGTEVYDKIRDGITDLYTPGYDQFSGYGRINVGRTMQLSVRNGSNARIVAVPNTGNRAEQWFNVQGSGFTPGSTVRFCITAPGYEDDCSYSWTADSHGVAGLGFQPSINAPIGTWRVYSYDSTGRWTPEIIFTVLPPPH